MSVHNAQWNRQGTAVHIVIDAPFTAKEWLTSLQHARDLIHESGHRAYIVQEYRIPGNYIPQRALSYLHQINELGLSHDDLIQGVIQVRLHGFLRTVARVYVRTYGIGKSVFVDNLLEAYQFIAAQQAGV